MRVRATGEAQGLFSQHNLVHAPAGTSDSITHLDRTSHQSRLDAQAVKRTRYYRVYAQHLRLATHPQKASNDQTQCYTCAARVHAPAAVERNRPVEFMAMKKCRCKRVPGANRIDDLYRKSIELQKCIVLENDATSFAERDTDGFH